MNLVKYLKVTKYYLIQLIWLNIFQKYNTEVIMTVYSLEIFLSWKFQFVYFLESNRFKCEDLHENYNWRNLSYKTYINTQRNVEEINFLKFKACVSLVIFHWPFYSLTPLYFAWRLVTFFFSIRNNYSQDLIGDL